MTKICVYIMQILYYKRARKCFTDIVFCTINTADIATLNLNRFDIDCKEKQSLYINLHKIDE